MSSKAPVGRRISSFRILLLVALGGSVGIGFTPPGKWAAHELLRPLRPRPSFVFPLWLETARGADSRRSEVMRAVLDMQLDREDPSARRTLPTPALLADRLTGIDGWTTAVLFELGSSPGDLRAAGLENDLACVQLATGNPFQLGRRDRASWYTQGPIREWCLELLDDRGREVGNAWVSALRSGFTPHTYSEPDIIYVEDPSAPGDGDLPAVCVFHRNADGTVITG